MVTRLGLTAVAVALIALAAPTPASAHAVLESSSPARGDVVREQPRQVELRFDEPVERAFATVRVFDTQGRRVDQGSTFHPGGDQARLAVRLRPRLAEGTYTATYRILSVDSHVVSGGSVFSIGVQTTSGAIVEELLGESGAGSVTSVAFSAVRALQYGSIAIGVGAVVFLSWIWSAVATARVPALDRRVRLLLVASAAAGATSALAAVALEAAQAAGVDVWAALDPSILREVASTRFGTMWSLGAAAWLIVGVFAAVAFGRVPLLVLAAPCAFLVAMPGLGGHASAQDPVAVLLPANVLHVTALAAWLGGLVCLLAAVPAATRSVADDASRTRLLAKALERFSPVALVAAVVLLVTGSAQAVLQIGEFDRVFSTAYGRAVAIKLALLATLIGVGALQRRRTMPALRRAAREGRAPGAPGVFLRRVLRVEVVLVVAALATTGALAGYAPAAAVQPGPFSADARVGPQSMQLTIDPARVGANEIHVYLTDPGSGRQADSTREVQISATLPDKGIGASTATGEKAGPGHYVFGGFALGVRGDWQITVTVRVSRFDQYTARLRVPVR